MNILKSYSMRVAKIVFASKMSRETFDYKEFNTYAFLCTSDLAKTLSPGDFIVVDTRNGLHTGVFVEFSIKLKDINLASKHVICKIADYTVDSNF